MCLYSVNVDHRYPINGEAYKAIRVYPNSWDSPYYGGAESGNAAYDCWYDASKASRPTLTRPFSACPLIYPAGFHVFPTFADAMTYWRGHDMLRAYCHIVRVRYAGLLVAGEEVNPYNPEVSEVLVVRRLFVSSREKGHTCA